MTAMELYREDRRSRKETGARMPRQEYFALLRDALHDELMREGQSEFLDAMLAEADAGKALPMLEFAALRECYEMIVENRPMQDASEFVPHIYRSEEERFRWRDLGHGASYRVDNPEFAQLLLRLRNVSLQLTAVRDETVRPDITRAARKEIDSLLTLNRALEEDNAALRAQREELRARIAALEEGCITSQIEQRLSLRRRQAEEALEQELAQRRIEAEGALQEALGYAAREQLQAADDAQRAGDDRAEAYARLQEDMRAELTAMQQRLEEQLTGWQGRLYSADHHFLARSYTALEAAVKQETSRVIAQAQMDGADTALLASLSGLYTTLESHIRQLEQALALLGMRVFRPQAGEAFDPAKHSLASAGMNDAPLAMAVIDRAETPGVMWADGAQAGQTLVRAVVHVRRGDQPWQA